MGCCKTGHASAAQGTKLTVSYVAGTFVHPVHARHLAVRYHTPMGLLLRQPHLCANAKTSRLYQYALNGTCMQAEWLLGCGTHSSFWHLRPTLAVTQPAGGVGAVAECGWLAPRLAAYSGALLCISLFKWPHHKLQLGQQPRVVKSKLNRRTYSGRLVQGHLPQRLPCACRQPLLHPRIGVCTSD